MTPLPRTLVLCLDEIGPLAVKTYLGEEWQRGSWRATFEPDYGRRGRLWMHGAFEMVYRSLYFCTTAFHRGEALDPVLYLAENAKLFGLLKRKRKPDSLHLLNLTFLEQP